MSEESLASIFRVHYGIRQSCKWLPTRRRNLWPPCSGYLQDKDGNLRDCTLPQQEDKTSSYKEFILCTLNKDNAMIPSCSRWFRKEWNVCAMSVITYL
jgi:hypothetical protein